MMLANFRRSLGLACWTVFGIYVLGTVAFGFQGLGFLAALYVAPVYVLLEKSFDRPIDIWLIMGCFLSATLSILILAVLDSLVLLRLRGSLILLRRVILQIAFYIAQVVVVILALRLLTT